MELQSRIFPDSGIPEFLIKMEMRSVSAGAAITDTWRYLHDTKAMHCFHHYGQSDGIVVQYLPSKNYLKNLNAIHVVLNHCRYVAPTTFA